MTTIAFVGDSHFDSRSRFNECVRLHDWIAEEVARRGVGLLVHTGDMFERKSTAEERNAVAAWLSKVAETCPVLLVKGNHDAEGDLAIFRRLRTQHPVLVEETMGVRYVAGVAVAAVSWPRRSEILADLGVPLTREDANAVAAEALRNAMGHLGEAISLHDGPRVLAGHLSVSGCLTSTGQPLVGADLEVSLSDLGLARAHFTALGHIHLPQEWAWSGAPIVYTGSPRRTAYGEVEDKGFVLAHVDGARLVSWERVLVPATPMVLAVVAWDGTDFVGDCQTLPFGFWRGAEVRVRCRVASDHRDSARAALAQIAADWREDGAVDVKVEEEVIAVPRSPERIVPAVASATTREAQLAAYWEARKIEVTPTRRERLLARLTDVRGRAA